ncbi:MAG: carbohydrate ABC transporter permease [Treponema sp.]|jgi:raffinose/stachyose/melibiose transport system permease protein|nr:carbohydrate ABC transporter permease [Treponema sp.]
MRPNIKKQFGKIALYAVLAAVAVLWAAPIYTLIATAIKSKQDFYNNAGLFSLPESVAWNNFTDAFFKGRLFAYMRNDLVICCLKVPLGILIEALAAFALTRLKIKHKTGLFIFFIIGMMLPFQAALVPINVVYSRLGLLNTYFGLFYVYIGFGISYGILVLRGFFRTIPRDIDDAAVIDGCGKWRLLWNIILPISKPAIATLVITDFLATWNEYLLAMVIINDNNKKTVPVGLMTFVGEHGTDYGLLCAGVLISLLPVLAVYVVFQRHFVEGLSGSVKQ